MAKKNKATESMSDSMPTQVQPVHLQLFPDLDDQAMNLEQIVKRTNNNGQAASLADQLREEEPIPVSIPDNKDTPDESNPKEKDSEVVVSAPTAVEKPQSAANKEDSPIATPPIDENTALYMGKIDEVYERSVKLLSAVSKQYESTTKATEAQKAQITALLTSLSETEKHSLQFVKRLNTLADLYTDKVKELSEILKNNIRLVRENNGITRPKPRNGASAIYYYCLELPVYYLKSLMFQPWFKTFLLLVLPTLLFCSVMVNWKQHRLLTDTVTRHNELVQYEMKYNIIRELSRPGSNLDEFCRTLDIYYADPKYYSEQIDSLSRSIQQQKTR